MEECFREIITFWGQLSNQYQLLKKVSAVLHCKEVTHWASVPRNEGDQQTLPLSIGVPPSKSVWKPLSKKGPDVALKESLSTPSELQVHQKKCTDFPWTEEETRGREIKNSFLLAPLLIPTLSSTTITCLSSTFSVHLKHSYYCLPAVTAKAKILYSHSSNWYQSRKLMSRGTQRCSFGLVITMELDRKKNGLKIISQLWMQRIISPSSKKLWTCIPFLFCLLTLLSLPTLSGLILVPMCCHHSAPRVCQQRPRGTRMYVGPEGVHG